MHDQLHVVGARPNFIKAAPVIDALRTIGSQPILVHTGQHYDEVMSRVFFEQLGIPKPDRDLGVGSGSHGAQTASLLIALEELMVEIKPSRVVVYGDVNSTMAAAIVAAKLHVPVAHVEAGLRSFDRSMPEEINRVVTDALADLHFTTSVEARGLLMSEGVLADGIHFVGNPMIDTLLRFRDNLDVAEARNAFGLGGEYAVCTLHRPANVDDARTAQNLVDALRGVARLVPIVLPLHPRGRSQLMAMGLGEIEGLHVCDPLGYLEFMALMAGASLVLSDSGGIQEETTILGIPCLTLRDNTERPVTVSMGTNRLVGSDPDLIVRSAVDALTEPRRGDVPPLWDGKAGLRIAQILRN
jgi:UDP-N-acetylglucosamine 2-epimerase (non-hydrolysing)